MERSNWKRPRNYHSWTHHNGHCCWKTLTNWMCVQIITHHCHSDRHRCAEIFVNTSNMVTSTWTNHRIRARTKLSLGSNAFWNAKRLDIPAHWIQKSQVCLKQFCFSFSLKKSMTLFLFGNSGIFINGHYFDAWFYLCCVIIFFVFKTNRTISLLQFGLLLKASGLTLNWHFLFKKNIFSYKSISLFEH